MLLGSPRLQACLYSPAQADVNAAERERRDVSCLAATAITSQNTGEDIPHMLPRTRNVTVAQIPRAPHVEARTGAAPSPVMETSTGSL